jgi:hypothetical protein
MSKREDPMIGCYWQQVGGTLIKEFPAVKRARTCGQRLMDGVILSHGPHRTATRRGVSLEGQDIVVQAKRGRLGMVLMGQTLFSADVMKRFRLRDGRFRVLCVLSRPSRSKPSGTRWQHIRGSDARLARRQAFDPFEKSADS